MEPGTPWTRRRLVDCQHYCNYKITTNSVAVFDEAGKLPEAMLQEDENLLTLYDMALTRSEEN